MNFFRYSIATSLLVLGTLSGCSLLGTKDKPMAQLPSVESSMQLRTVWSASNGANLDRQSLGLTNTTWGPNLYSATAFGQVTARSTLTGEELWHVKLPDTLSSGPAVSGGACIVSSHDGQLFAMNADDGRPLWIARLQSETLSPVTIDAKNDRVYVHGTDSSIHALSLSDGSHLWTSFHEAPSLTLRDTSQPLVVDDLVIVGQPSGRILALDARSGEQEWESQLAIPTGRTDIQRMVDIVAKPQAVSDKLYVVSYQGKLAAMSLANGRLLWEKSMSVVADFTIDEDTLYITDKRDVVWAINRHTGETLWRQEGLYGRGLTGPVVWEGALLVGDKQGYLHWLNPQTGQWENWRSITKQALLAPLSTEQGDLLVAGQSGRLTLFRKFR